MARRGAIKNSRHIATTFTVIACQAGPGRRLPISFPRPPEVTIMAIDLAQRATAAENYVPRVWVGCLTCYNEGELVGRWHDAINASDVLPEDLHGVTTSHEEPWAFDCENLPTRQEMNPATATRWTQVIESIEDSQREAFLAYLGGSVLLPLRTPRTRTPSMKSTVASDPRLKTMQRTLLKKSAF